MYMSVALTPYKFSQHLNKWPSCTKMDRTDTTRRTDFELPSPKAATFSFSSPAAIRIAVPLCSKWRMPLHWHYQGLGCRSVKCVDGSLRVYVARGSRGSYDKLGREGMTVQFQLGQLVTWGCSETDKTKSSVEPLAVDLDADEVLHRNICSAIFDRDLVPELRSTPLWLKALFVVLEWIPTLRQRLLAYVLWIQLQVIFYAHDFQLYHGHIPITWLWTAQLGGGRPPQWALDLQLRTYYLISRVVMSSCYWAGRLFLGMRGEYPQYTTRGGTSEKSG